MSESLAHQKLVSELVSWIAEMYFEGSKSLISVDSCNCFDRPPNINGYIPDAFVNNGPDELFLIGEAKTAKDIERNHSIEQYSAFIKECNNYNNSVFVLAPPWDLVISTKLLLENIKNKTGAENVSIIVLEKLIV